MAIKTFTTGEVLTASDTNTYLNNGGLVLITSGITVSSAGGTAATIANGTVTIGSANTSVTVNGAFSSTYDNYRIVVSNVTASASSNMQFRFSASGTPVSGGNYAVAGFFLSGNSTLGGKYSLTDTFFEAFRMETDSANYCAFDLLGPNLAKYTNTLGMGSFAGTVSYNYNGRHSLATSYSDFQLFPSSGNVTGGQIRVYGYRQV